MSKLELHLAALAAAGAGMGLATQADAAIVYSGAVNINIPSTTAGVYLNVVTGVSSGVPASAPGWDVNPWGSAPAGFSFFNPAAPAGGVYVRNVGTTGVSNLAPGAIIGPASTYTSGAGQTTGTGLFNLNSSNNIVGFRFNNEATGAVHYGWMRISLGATYGAQPRAIVEYAYESQPGVAIAAKDGVPTPGAASLLAIGAAGLVGRRRRA